MSLIEALKTKEGKIVLAITIIIVILMALLLSGIVKM